MHSRRAVSGRGCRRLPVRTGMVAGAMMLAMEAPLFAQNTEYCFYHNTYFNGAYATGPDPSGLAGLPDDGTECRSDMRDPLTTLNVNPVLKNDPDPSHTVMPDNGDGAPENAVPADKGRVTAGPVTDLLQALPELFSGFREISFDIGPDLGARLGVSGPFGSEFSQPAEGEPDTHIVGYTQAAIDPAASDSDLLLFGDDRPAASAGAPSPDSYTSVIPLSQALTEGKKRTGTIAN